MRDLQQILDIRDRCEEEGRRAHVDGLLQYDNPYFSVDQHEERSSWANGWWEEEDGAFTPLSMQTKPRLTYPPIAAGNPSNPMKVA